MPAQSQILKELRLHLWEVLGFTSDLEAIDYPQLPPCRRERFAFYRTDMLGQTVTLVVERESTRTSPSQWQRIHGLLESETKSIVILVLPGLQAYVRNRLVRMQVSFITPGKHIFMPRLMTDLREKFAAPLPPAGKPLSAVAQLLVLLQLLKPAEVRELSLKRLGLRLGYTAASMTFAKKELVANGLCRTTKHGKELHLEFVTAGRALWEKVLPQLSSPVRETLFVEWPERMGPFAGFSALDRLTDIIDDRVPTRAGSRKDLREARKSWNFKKFPYEDEATLKLEVWSYDPRLLTDRATVDPLSLYLSKRYANDERVQQALETLLKSVW